MLAFNQFFLNSPWPGLTAVALLYISDYAMTLTCARMYRGKVSEHMAFEGSYEITPYFQRDIDSLKKISPRFFGTVLLVSLLLGIVWILAIKELPEIYIFYLGSIILLQLAIHIRHLQNFFVFQEIITGNTIRGRIEYSRSFLLRNSSNQMFAFAGLYLVLFAFLPAWFLLGGVATCISVAVKHRRLARKADLVDSTSSKPEQAQTPTS